MDTIIPLAPQVHPNLNTSDVEAIATSYLIPCECSCSLGADPEGFCLLCGKIRQVRTSRSLAEQLDLVGASLYVPANALSSPEVAAASAKAEMQRAFPALTTAENWALSAWLASAMTEWNRLASFAAAQHVPRIVVQATENKPTPLERRRAISEAELDELLGEL